MSNHALSSDVKKALKAAVLSLRELLEGEFDQDTFDPVQPGGDVVRQLARFGIDGNRPESLAADKTPDYLTDDEKKNRQRICAAIRREASLFGQPSNKIALKRGLRAFVRETSYTWINRLLGLKCMEVRGLLKDEHGEQDFVVTSSDQYGGLPRRAWRIKGKDPAKWQKAKVYELLCAAIADSCRQLTEEIKVLFDPDQDYGLIWPSPQALTAMLQKIRELADIPPLSLPSPSTGEGQGGGGPFASHDFLGWVYQYFQTKEKRQVFEAASKKKKKIEKDDIIAATQIYTEQYMVEYLVQNTLGRLWMEMHPDSRLSGAWAYYVKPAVVNRPHPALPLEGEGKGGGRKPLKNAIDLKLMDPALGSGHFHLVAFDLLFEMYLEEIESVGKPGWPETPSVTDQAVIPSAILEHNLYGMDIDARAIQIATLSLYMKARETGYSGPIQAIHFVTANAAPFDSPSWHNLIKDLNDKGRHSVARVLATLGAQLKNLDEYGSLLRIEEEMERMIREEKKKWFVQTKAGWEQDYLFSQMARPRQQKIPFEEGITDEAFFDELSPIIEKELDDFYLTARKKGLAEEAILATDADRGFDFLRLCMDQYDVVYTNPPYMGSKNMGKELKDFVAHAYPQGKRDLYAAFILRCLEMAEQNGYVGMVTQQSWMFLRSFADLRALPEDRLQKAEGTFKGLLRETTIETLAHLGPHAFSEIGGEVVNTALFSFRKIAPPKEHTMTAFRLIAPKSPQEKDRLLIEAIGKDLPGVMCHSNQKSITALPEFPIVYWVDKDLLALLFHGTRISNQADVRRGLDSGDDDRFLRCFWELTDCSNGWPFYSKGGGYRKWFGFEHWVIDWRKGTEGFAGVKGARVQNVSYYFKPFLTYSLMASGSLGVRRVADGAIPGGAAGGIFPEDSDAFPLLASILNSRIVSYSLRLVSPDLKFREGYVANAPLRIPKDQIHTTITGDCCIQIKRSLTAWIATERAFHAQYPFSSSSTLVQSILTFIESQELLCAVLHTLEANLENRIAQAFQIRGDSLQRIISETSIPAGWHSQIHGLDAFPSLPNHFPILHLEVDEFTRGVQKRQLSQEEIAKLKTHLRRLYEVGPGVRVEENGSGKSSDDDERAEVAMGAYIPIPPETFIEELSQKLEIHPISVYWLLKEMREKEGLRCPSEEKRHAEDYVSVIIIRMLGYQWPKQVEAGEPFPEWADEDGIIPLTEGLGEPTLLERVRERFGTDFGEEKEASIEAEFGNTVGKPLARWLEEDFFERHVKQFRNRPIAWHVVSDPSVADSTAGASAKGKRKTAKSKRSPAFSVMVNYHRFVDGEKGYRMLQLLRNKYLEKLLTQTRTELEGLRGKGADPKVFDRIAELDRRMIELEHFKEKLDRIQEGKDREARIYVRWKGPEEQSKGWRPDINDGVKINIAPWERLGMFPVKKIVGNVEMGE